MFTNTISYILIQICIIKIKFAKQYIVVPSCLENGIFEPDENKPV